MLSFQSAGGKRPWTLAVVAMLASTIQGWGEVSY
jgi:hypothetical protein